MKKNFTTLERVLSIAAGGALATYGFTPKTEYKRLTLPGVLSTVAGAGLAVYGLFFQKKRSRSTRNILLGALGAGLVVRGITGKLLISGRRDTSDQLFGEHTAYQRKGKKINRTIIVNAPVDKVYKLWSNFENFPQWMENVESVKYLGPDRTHWKIKGPAGLNFEYDARIKTHIPNELISWESVSGDLPNAGTVRFQNINGSTRVETTLEFHPLAGIVGEAVSDFLRDPEKRLEEDLTNFKKIAEGVKATGKTA
jgi:uncharacterized membrane protein